MTPERAVELYKKEIWFLMRCEGLVKGYKEAQIVSVDPDDKIPFHEPGSAKVEDSDGKSVIIPLYMLSEYTPPKSTKSKRTKGNGAAKTNRAVRTNKTILTKRTNKAKRTKRTNHEKSKRKAKRTKNNKKI